MNKYIDAEKLIAEIDMFMNPNTEWKHLSKEEISFMGRCKTYLFSVITSLQQEQPKLTQVPRIEQETQKKGWMDYSLLISEIGLHRSNAIDRIKETKERADKIKRNIAPHDLAILGKYLESVGAEIVLCCLQQYCMDFMFTQDEVKEIIQQEHPEVDLEKGIKSYFRGWEYDPYSCEITTAEGNAPTLATLRGIARHFYELGLNAREK